MRSTMIVATFAVFIGGCAVHTASNTGITQADAQMALYKAGYRNVALSPSGDGGWVGSALKTGVTVDANGHVIQ